MILQPRWNNLVGCRQMSLLQEKWYESVPDLLVRVIMHDLPFLGIYPVILDLSKSNFCRDYSVWV
jgi:hypothetical protein